MKVKCRLEIAYSNKKIAKVVYESVKVDDEGFVKSSIDGNRIVADIEADSPGSLLHTLNDYLACISVAEKVLDKN